MARQNYQYGTSPRKIQPEYDYTKKTAKRKKKEKTKIDYEKQLEQERIKRMELKHKKKIHYKNVALILSMFLILLAVSYRSSLITERFNEIQQKKSELAGIQKTNGQLEVGIEESINLSNIEKEAKNGLGMKKMTNDQKVYVDFNIDDYTESGTVEISSENKVNWFEKILNKLIGK